MGVILAAFQSPGQSPNLCDFSEVMENNLEMMSANSLNTLGWIVLGSIDLLRSSSCNSSHANSFFIDSRSVFASTWIFVYKAWGPAVLGEEDRGEESVENL